MTDNKSDFRSILISPQVIAALITGMIAIVATLLPLWLDRNNSTPPVTATEIAIIPSSTPDATTSTPAMDASETPLPASATPQSLPTRTPLPPTATLIPATDAPAPNVILLYDDVSLTVYNDTQQTLSLDGVQFLSNSRRWNATQWGASLAAALPADNCLRMRDATSGNRQPPAICGNLLGFMQVGGSALFWLEGSTFDVQYNGETLITCDTTATRCPVYIPQ